MKPKMVLKNWSDEAFNASPPNFIASSLLTLCEFMQKSSFNSAELSDTYVKAKTMKFLGFVTENTEI